MSSVDHLELVDHVGVEVGGHLLLLDYIIRSGTWEGTSGVRKSQEGTEHPIEIAAMVEL